MGHLSAVIGFLLIWLVSIVVHDDWLYPWSRIWRVYCLLAVLWLVAYVCWCRGARVLAAALRIVCALIMVLTFPTPDYKKSMLIQNDTQEVLAVRVNEVDGVRRKAFVLAPGNSRQFVYFLADGQYRGPADVAIEIEASASGFVRRQNMTLPLNSQAQPLVVTRSWFTNEIPP